MHLADALWGKENEAEDEHKEIWKTLVKHLPEGEKK